VRFYGLYVSLLGISLAGCPPSVPPAPVPPDATDAAPAPPGPSTPCQAACDRLALLCGPQPADCVTVYAAIDGRRLVRTSSGAPLTCAAVASAVDKPGMVALGITCP
jgi:hypothetical protein